MKVLARTVLLCIATVSGVSSSTELGAQTREPPYIIVDDEANAFAIIGYIAGSALVLGGSAVLGAYNSIGNRHGQHKTVSMLGVAAGVGAVGLAAFTYENNRGAKDAGKVSAGIATLGALSVVTGVRGLLRRKDRKSVV